MSLEGRLVNESEDVYPVYLNTETERLRLDLDEKKMTQIVNNLLSNALKFTPRNGTVSFKVEDLSNVLRLTASDTGRGIHPDDLPHVFDRFYQTNQANAAIEGGTGIGLALCRELVDMRGGGCSSPRR